MTRYAILALVVSLFLQLCKVMGGERCMYINYRGRNSSSGVDLNCTQIELCQKVLNITHIHFPPYSTAYLLQSTLKNCCGVCMKFQINELKNITEVSFQEMNSTDFLLPILGRSDAHTLYGHHFIPIIDVPNVFYFTPKHTGIMEELLLECAGLYPLFIVLLLLAMILGFAIWCVETRCNEIQFPRSFISGMIEGCWYCFTAMTTVGFGERTVKSNPGRVLSVITILIGIIMFGLLTSLFTAEIMKVTEPNQHRMEGCKVGVLKYRDYDAGVVVDHGGLVIETSAWNFFSDVLMLFKMLRTQQIDGFVIDKYTLTYTEQYLDWKQNNSDHFLYGNDSAVLTSMRDAWKEDIDFFKFNTYRTYKSHDGGKLSYGVLVKDRDVYEYFKHAIMDNRYSLQVGIGSEMNRLFPRVSKAGKLSLSGCHYELYYVLCGMVVVIFLFGIAYEIYNHRKTLNGNDSEDNESNSFFNKKVKDSVDQGCVFCTKELHSGSEARAFIRNITPMSKKISTKSLI